MPVEIVWSALARRRLQEIHEYVSRDKPGAAQSLVLRIVAAVENLRNYPHLGRAGTNPSTRELVIGRTPYIVVYRLRADIVRIVTVWHGAQRQVR